MSRKLDMKRATPKHHFSTEFKIRSLKVIKVEYFFF